MVIKSKCAALVSSFIANIDFFNLYNILTFLFRIVILDPLDDAVIEEEVDDFEHSEYAAAHQQAEIAAEVAWTK